MWAKTKALRLISPNNSLSLLIFQSAIPIYLLHKIILPNGRWKLTTARERENTDLLSVAVMIIVVGIAILLYAFGMISLMQAIPIMSIGVGLWILALGLMKKQRTSPYGRSKAEILLWAALIIVGGVVWLVSTIMPELGLVWLSLLLISSGLIIVASYVLGKRYV
jgi:hypothetical protein